MVSYGNTMLTDFHLLKFQVINHIIKYKIEACPKHKTRWIKQHTSFERYKRFQSSYSLTYSSAESLGLLNRGRPFFPVKRHLSLSLNFHLPQILLHICQPSHSWSSHSSTFLQLTLKQFLNCPYLNHSYNMSNRTQTI